MTFNIDLQWPAFNVDLNTVDAWMKANAGSSYCGLSADYDLSAHFTAEPGDDVRAAATAYWAALTIASAEHTNYKSDSQRKAEAAAAKATALASANAKLEALGLTANEIAALRG